MNVNNFHAFFNKILCLMMCDKFPWGEFHILWYNSRLALQIISIYWCVWIRQFQIPWPWFSFVSTFLQIFCSNFFKMIISTILTLNFLFFSGNLMTTIILCLLVKILWFRYVQLNISTFLFKIDIAFTWHVCEWKYG